MFSLDTDTRYDAPLRYGPNYQEMQNTPAAFSSLPRTVPSLHTDGYDTYMLYWHAMSFRCTSVAQLSGALWKTVTQLARSTLRSYTRKHFTPQTFNGERKGVCVAGGHSTLTSGGYFGGYPKQMSLEPWQLGKWTEPCQAG